ncbi:probable polyadenylate-binding protein 5 at N-terminal half [Coccomyxa sp. Obi]|nr:probable polyadenylate-binding protein 5 at N-terminal half [Coccomyxa sp. Obi]
MLRENNVYVKNLAPDVDDAKLLDMFKEYGNVKSCRVLFDHNGVSKQVAFVQFETNQQALDSIAALHNKEAGGAKPLHVALALSKLDRQRKARLCSSEGRRINGEVAVTAQPFWMANGNTIQRGLPPMGPPMNGPMVSHIPANRLPPGPYYMAPGPYPPYTNGHFGYSPPMYAAPLSGFHFVPQLQGPMMPPMVHPNPPLVPVTPHGPFMDGYMVPAPSLWSAPPPPRMDSWAHRKPDHAGPGRSVYEPMGVSSHAHPWRA